MMVAGQTVRDANRSRLVTANGMVKGSARIWAHLGFRDLRSRYARTRLGVWWSASTLLAVVAGISLSISLVGNGNPLDIAPRVAVAMGMWTFISNCLVDSAEAFHADRGLLLNLPISEKLMTARLIWRNYLVLLHNAVVMGLVVLLGSGSFAAVLRLVLVVGILVPVFGLVLFVPAHLISRMSVVLPDLRVFVGTAVQLNFFITPIFWDPPADGVMLWIFRLNPLGWLIQLAKELVFLTFLPSQLLALVIASGLVMAAAYHFYVRRLAGIKRYL